jgi:hypothetical protein
MNRYCKTRIAARVLIWITYAMLVGTVRAQTLDDEDTSIGYSYVRMSIDGHAISNFVHDAKYVGWLTVEGVEISRRGVLVKGSAGTASDGVYHNDPKTERNWADFPATLDSGRRGPGEIRFGAGDAGGFRPAFDAMKKGTLIREAELIFYNFETAKFVGKYKIKGIRVRALEDIQASACPMYEVTLRFQSIEKE